MYRLIWPLYVHQHNAYMYAYIQISQNNCRQLSKLVVVGSALHNYLRKQYARYRGGRLIISHDTSISYFITKYRFNDYIFLPGDTSHNKN